MITGRYKILNKVGEGSVGTVYRARRRSDGMLVALKKLKPNVSPRALARSFFAGSTTTSDNSPVATSQDIREDGLKREFIYMNNVRHPNLVEVFDLDVDSGNNFCLIMELLDGESLGEILGQEQTALTGALICDYLIQLLRGLAFLHVRGFVHRDLKPANLFVSREGRLKILDYGVMTEYTASGRESAGTRQYTAPEVLNGASATPLSDLYAVGVLLKELLQRSARAQPDGPAGRVKNEPGARALQAIMRSLLQSRPERRYQSAEDALTELIKQTDAPTMQETQGTLRSFVLASGLLGRDRELQVLKNAFDRCHSGQGELLCLAGESGIGKTRLTNELATYAKVNGASVFRGHYYEGVNDSLSAVREILCELIPVAPKELLRRFASDLSNIVPDHLEAMEIGEARHRSYGTSRRISYAALAEFIVRCSRCSIAPMVVVLEDFHFHPDFSILEILREKVAESKLLVIASYRDDEIESGLPTVIRDATITLHPFPPDFYRQMAAAIFSQASIDSPLFAKLASYASGNPFFIEQLFLELASQNVLKRSGTKWQITDIQPDSIELPAVDQLLARRYRGLQSEEWRCLQFICACAQGISRSMLAELAPGPLLDDSLRRLHRKYVITENEGMLRAYHHRIQQYVYEHIPDKSKIHLRLGNTFERLHSDNLVELVYQFERSGDLPRRIAYTKKLADRNYRLGEYVAAATLYDKLLPALREQSKYDEERLDTLNKQFYIKYTLTRLDDARQALKELTELASTVNSIKGIGQALMGQALLAAIAARFSESIALLNSAIDNFKRCDFAYGLASAHATLGSVYRDCDQRAKSLQEYQNALQLCRLHEKHQMANNMLCSIGQIHSDMSNLTAAETALGEALQRSTELGDQRLEAIALSGLARLYLDHYDIDSALLTFNKARERMQAVGDKRELMLIDNNLVLTYLAAKKVQQAEKCLIRAQRLAKQFNAQTSIALNAALYGVLDAECGRYEQALQKFAVQADFAQISGNRCNYARVKYHCGIIAFRRGDFETARDYLDTALQLFKATDVIDVLNLKIQLVELHGTLGNQAEVELYCKEVIAVVGTLQSATAQGHFRCLLAQVLFKYAKYVDVQILAREAHMAAGNAGLTYMQIRSQCLMSAASLCSRSEQGASISSKDEEWQKLERLASDNHVDHETAAVLDKMWHLLRQGCVVPAAPRYRISSFRRRVWLFHHRLFAQQPLEVYRLRIAALERFASASSATT